MSMLKTYITILLFSFILVVHSQVGINNTTPKASLDITATNQVTPASTDGILIPRIDTFPITNPAASQNGMLVFLTTAVGANQPGFYYWSQVGTYWKPITAGATAPSGHYIGEIFGGGIVFFVYNNGANGLIASLNDLDGGFGVTWNGVSSAEIGFSAQSMTNGTGNTAAMVAQSNIANSAGNLCNSFTNGGYTDWYLPSNREFVLLAKQDYLIDLVLDNDGNPLTNGLIQEFSTLTHGTYWCSTEKNSNAAFYFSFPGGTFYANNKNFSFRVRAIRAF